MLTMRANRLTLLGLGLMAACGLRTISQDTLWLHLALGRGIASNGIPRQDTLSFTMAGQPWLNWSWLYDLSVYHAWQVGGAHLIILLHVSAVLGAFALLLPVARRFAGETATALALMLSAWILAPVFEPTPELLCFVFPAAFIHILARGTRPLPAAWSLVPLQWVWTQIHPSFVLGPVLCALFAIEQRAASGATQRPAPGPTRGMIALAAGLFVITALNPYFLALHRALLVSWGNVGTTLVRSWISPYSWQFTNAFAEYAVTAGLVVGALGIVTFPRRLPLALTTLAVLAAALAVLRRHLLDDWFALLSFPFLALSFDGIFTALESFRSRFETWARAFAWLFGLASLAWMMSSQWHNSVGSSSSFGLGVEDAAFPEAASAIIARADFPERALHLSADGGYLAWRHPARKIFVDARVDLYGTAFFQDFEEALSGKIDSLALFEERWRPGAAIINCCFPKATYAVRVLIASGRWALIYFDGTTAILVTRIQQHEEMIRSREIQSAGLQILERARADYLARCGTFLKPANSPRLIGAASLFLDLEKYREALAVHAALARGTKTMATAWIGLGYSQLQLDRPGEAVVSLEYAARRFSREIKAWLWLSRACAEAGQTERAAAAFARAQRLDPKMAAKFGDPTATPSPEGDARDFAPPPAPPGRL